MEERTSLKPLHGADRAARRRLGLKGELTLAALPTLTVLVALERSLLWLLARLSRAV